MKRKGNKRYELINVNESEIPYIMEILNSQISETRNTINKIIENLCDYSVQIAGIYDRKEKVKKIYLNFECGFVDLKAINESETHVLDQYSSASLNTAGKFDFTYGKIIAKIKLPSAKAIWPAFWMLGSNIDENGGDTLWPMTGEIDILELWGSVDAAVVEANVHYADANNKHAQMGAVGYHLPKGNFTEDFHEFELEWTKEELIWRVDGNTYHTLNITDKKYYAFHKDFFLLLNIAVGGEFAGYPDDTTPFPQEMIVDWIKVYQKK